MLFRAEAVTRLMLHLLIALQLKRISPAQLKQFPQDPRLEMWMDGLGESTNQCCIKPEPYTLSSSSLSPEAPRLAPAAGRALLKKPIVRRGSRAPERP